MCTISEFVKGQVFMVENQNTEYKGPFHYHNYIILGMKNYGHISRRVQMMTISSCHKGASEFAVPIMLSNYNLSYVLPYNIYGVSTEVISFEHYHGTLQDDVFTRDKFIELLMDLYLMENNLPMAKTNEEVVLEYNEYCEAFFSKYGPEKLLRTKSCWQGNETSVTFDTNDEIDEPEVVDEIPVYKVRENKKEMKKVDRKKSGGRRYMKNRRYE